MGSMPAVGDEVPVGAHVLFFLNFLKNIIYIYKYIFKET